MVPSPFDYSDVVTTTTHKSLRGPRGAMIFFRKGVKGQDKKGKDVMYDLESKINFAVFPGAQVHLTSRLACCLLCCSLWLCTDIWMSCNKTLQLSASGSACE